MAALAASVVLNSPEVAHSNPPAGSMPAGAVHHSLKSENTMTQTAPAFKPDTFANLPGWEQDDHAAAFKAFLKSCDRVIAAVKAGNKAGPKPPTPALLSACDAALQRAAKPVPEAAARVFFETHFTPHRVMHASDTGLLTGYYEPVIEAARAPSPTFATPIHRRPPDLVNIVDEASRGARGDALTHGRKTAKGIEPYATRADIEQGALKGRGLELVYVASSVEKFFMQVQGSGRLKLPDGSMVRVSYDGKNGHPYTSIGRHLIDTGAFPADKMSLAALGAWLKADPVRGRLVMWQNKSYVFFRELQGEEAKSALGVLNIPLTPGRSLAVDAAVHAIGTPVYVHAPGLTHATPAGGFRRLMIAQDVGSAIKGPERGDIFFGSGRVAGKVAGVTKHPGNLFVLLPNDGVGTVAVTKSVAKRSKP